MSKPIKTLSSFIFHGIKIGAIVFILLILVSSFLDNFNGHKVDRLQTEAKELEQELINNANRLQTITTQLTESDDTISVNNRLILLHEIDSLRAIIRVDMKKFSDNILVQSDLLNE